MAPVPKLSFSTPPPSDVEKRRHNSFGDDPTHPVPPDTRVRPKYANPAPLGLFSFATTTLLISFINAETRGVTTPNVIVGMALCVGGIAQLVSGLFEFWIGNTFAMTVSCSYGTFWMAFGLLHWPSSGIMEAYSSHEELNNAIGLFMLVWFVFTVIMTIGALRGSLGLFISLGGLAITYLLLGLGHLLDTAPIIEAAGVVGCCTAFAAFYTATSDLFRTLGMPFRLRDPSMLRKRD